MSEQIRVIKVGGILSVVASGYYSKFWVARLTGLDPKYTFTREFLGGGSRRIIHGEFSRIVETGRNQAKIDKNGIYQIRCAPGYGTLDYFINVTDGKNGVYEVINGEGKYNRAIEIVKAQIN